MQSYTFLSQTVPGYITRPSQPARPPPQRRTSSHSSPPLPFTHPPLQPALTRPKRCTPNCKTPRTSPSSPPPPPPRPPPPLAPSTASACSVPHPTESAASHLRQGSSLGCEGQAKGGLRGEVEGEDEGEGEGEVGERGERGAGDEGREVGESRELGLRSLKPTGEPISAGRRESRVCEAVEAGLRRGRCMLVRSWRSGGLYVRTTRATRAAARQARSWRGRPIVGGRGRSGVRARHGARIAARLVGGDVLSVVAEE